MTVEATILPTSGRRQAAVALIIATAMQAFDSTIANVACLSSNKVWVAGLISAPGS
jgi:hypothetical protein